MNNLSAKEADAELQNLLPVVTNEESAPIDILSRQEIVGRIFDVLETLSTAKGSCAFALNGKWGTGKTFILQMLERQLQDYRAGEQFIVFHYNCWQYDYYEEPLTAIVAAMLDNIDKSVSILSRDTKTKVQLGLAKTAQEVLKRIAASFISNKIGIDASNISDIVDAIQKEASEGIGAQHEYDGHYAFKKVIENAKNELAKLTEQQTLIVVVDELDRCPPDYAIKTLERLHHLFGDLNNTVLLIALDKTQLNSTIKTIFGESTDCDSYLKKFIDFEFRVNVGTVNDGFFKKYSDYVALFDESALEPWADINNYISLLFSQMEIRRQEHLVKKLQMIHQLLFGTQEIKKDYSFLCFELLMGVLSENGGATETAPFHYVEAKVMGGEGEIYSHYRLKIETNVPSLLADFVKAQWKYTVGFGQGLDRHYPVYSGTLDFPLLIIGYSELTYGQTGILAQSVYRSKYEGYINDFKAVKQLLEIIE